MTPRWLGGTERYIASRGKSGSIPDPVLLLAVTVLSVDVCIRVSVHDESSR